MNTSTFVICLLVCAQCNGFLTPKRGRNVPFFVVFGPFLGGQKVIVAHFSATVSPTCQVLRLPIIIVFLLASGKKSANRLSENVGSENDDLATKSAQTNILVDEKRCAMKWIFDPLTGSHMRSIGPPSLKTYPKSDRF